jgi:hypothetical protein
MSLMGSKRNEENKWIPDFADVGGTEMEAYGTGDRRLAYMYVLCTAGSPAAASDT